MVVAVVTRKTFLSVISCKMSGRGDCAWISMTGCQVHGTAHQRPKCGNLSNIKVKVWKCFKDQSVEICQISKCGNLSNVRLWNVETEQNSQNHYDRNHSRTPKYWMSFHCNVQIPVGTPRQVHLRPSKWDQKVEQVHDNLRGCWWANSCKKSQCSSVNLHRHHRKRGQRWSRGYLSIIPLL